MVSSWVACRVHDSSAQQRSAGSCVSMPLPPDRHQPAQPRYTSPDVASTHSISAASSAAR